MSEAQTRLSAVAACVVVSLTLVACTTRPATRAETSGSPSSHASGSRAGITMADVGDCSVTLPSRSGPSEPPHQRFFGWGRSYGNGKLWVGGLWPHGIIRADADFVDRRGRIRMKFGWWRGVRGRLTITGRRLDADAPPIRADVPDGYGSHGFQASGVTFPTEGCWEVTGSVGDVSIRFVTFVVKS